MKVVFLDIDGVLQPYNSRQRFEIDKVELQKDLTKQLGVDYMVYDEYDVAAAVVDWDEDAVERIRNILVKTGAKIVISSDWRCKRLPNKVKDFLKIWDLDQYWYADNAYFDEELMKDTIEYLKNKFVGRDFFNYRAVEIMDYVFKHKEITNYVSIDDMNMSEYLGDHFVKTNNLINDEEMEKAIKILNDDTLTVN